VKFNKEMLKVGSKHGMCVGWRLKMTINLFQ